MQYNYEVNLAKNEKLMLWGLTASFGSGVAKSLENLKESVEKLLSSGDPAALYSTLHYLREVKKSVQHVHNFNHQVACLAAKAFLESRYASVDWGNVDFLNYDVNSRGPDILYTGEIVKIVGNVKTTEPVRGKTSDFGAKQKEEILKDLKNLSSPKYAEYDRYMFVTSPKSFSILEKKYLHLHPCVRYVLLRNADTQEVLEQSA
jgi:hypothetical protein